MVEPMSGTAVPVRVAAQRLGLSVDALRKRIARGQVEVRRVNSGKGVHVVLPPEPLEPEPEPQNDGTAAIAAEAVAALREAVVALKDQLAAKDRQLEELQRLVSTMASQRPAPSRGVIPRIHAWLFGTARPDTV